MNKLRPPESLYQGIFQSIPENLLITTTQGRISLVNRHCLEDLKLQQSEIIGESIEKLLSVPFQAGIDFPGIWQTVQQEQVWQGELLVKSREKTSLCQVQIRHIKSQGNALHPSYLFRLGNQFTASDGLTDQPGLEFYDQLTALPNRFLFKKKLEFALEQAKRYQFNIGFLYIDLDNFKYINKSYGYLAGDQFLRMVGQRLKATARKSDIIGYLGGDEFSVALIKISLDRLAGTVANRFLTQISAPFQMKKEQLNLGASIGISIFPDDGKDYETLVHSAETAMYSLKKQPEPERGYKFYQQRMSVDSSIRLKLESDLRQALSKDEFEVFYQPICDLQSNQIIGLEALIRWRHPKRGLIAPNQFIPVAEDLGLIIPIGKWVLQTACRQMKAWHRLSPEPLSLSVNLSRVQFRDEQLLDKLKEILNETAFDPQNLQLEITESSLTDNFSVALSVLNDLKSLGVLMAIDDFGVGTSSLATLKDLPVNTLKLDKSFIRTLPADSNDKAIVQTILTLGKTLGLKIIAEGIETKGQLEFLKTTTCDAYQGFYFSRPLPAPDIQTMLTEHF